MHTGLLTWIATFPPGSAPVMGPLVGSALGLIVILLGALFNAHLNRRRDERLLNSERRALAAALTAELTSVKETLLGNATMLKDNPPPPDGGFVVPDIAHSAQIFPQVLPKIGLLQQPDVIKAVVGAHILIAQYCENLILLGGILQQDYIPAHRRIIQMNASSAETVAELNGNRAAYMDEVIRALEPYL
jgi:hypothetical protein